MPSQNHLVGFAGLILFTVVPLGVGGGLHCIRHSAARDTAAARNWVETPCLIEKNEFVSGDDSQSLELVYRYEVDGDTYRGDRLDLMIGSMGDDDVFEEQIHERYPPGVKAICWVDPHDPSRSVFDRDHAAGALRRLWLLAFPFVCVGFGFAYLIISSLVTVLTERWNTGGSEAVAATPAPPPRRVPMFGGLMVLAGPANMRIVWIFVVGFLFIFVILDGPTTYGRMFVRPKQVQVPGRIIDVRAEPGHEMGVSVYRYTFTYDVEGRQYSNDSFTRGQKYKEGDDVTVTYETASPAGGAIAGARPTNFTWWHSLIPLGVLMLLLLGIGGMFWHGVRVLLLFRGGMAACARRMPQSLAAQQHEGERGEVGTMLSDYYFEANGQLHQARYFSHHTSKRRGGESKAPSQETYVLYNPRRPKNNVILDDEMQNLLLHRQSLASFLSHCAPPVLAAAAIAFMFMA